MEIIQSIFLGIVQGITEFFPVSSSGHLIAFRYLFNWNFVDNMTFDIALHFGTLLAICIYFFKDWLNLFLDGFKLRNSEGKLSVKTFKTNKMSKTGKMFWYLVVATIPGVIAGLLLDDFVEGSVRSSKYVPLIMAATLSIMGALLWIADKYSKKDVAFEKISFKQSILVGCAQALAIIPGFSRSGSTMTMARFLKIDREGAAKFSFLLGTPIMAGAVVTHLGDLFALQMSQLLPLIVGMVTSFVVGLICIKALMALIKKMGFGVFAIYRFCLAALLVIVFFVRG
ncbi:MAG: undecaprenyl-diphosphate phosphatase [Clostridia bacterium]